MHPFPDLQRELARKRIAKMAPAMLALGAPAHAALAAFAFAFGLQQSFLYNVTSALFFLGAAAIAHLGHIQLAGFLAFFEIMIFMTIHIYWFGWQDGYLLFFAVIIVPVYFFLYGWSLVARTSLSAAALAWLTAVSILAEPVVQVSPAVHTSLQVMNLVITGTTVMALQLLFVFMLGRAEREIARSTREREALMQLLSHDLKNLLGGTLVLTNLLQRTRDTNKLGQEHLDLIERNTVQANEMIDLTRSLFARDFESITLQDCDLNSLVAQSCSILAPALEQKTIALKVDIAEALRVRAEPTSLLNTVLNNLLSNAIKFSNAGGEITIQARQENGRIYLVFSDQGIGIPPSMLGQLFNPAVKTTRVGTAGERGTGFGLPLVKQFMLAYGGGIAVESRCGAASVTLAAKALDGRKALDDKASRALDHPAGTGTTFTLDFQVPEQPR